MSRAQSRINFVRRVTRMATKPHHHVPRDPSLVTTSNESNPRAMKTKMRKLVTPKKSPPRFPWHHGAFKGGWKMGVDHFLKHLDELGSQREFRDSLFLSLGSEPDDLTIEIHIRKRDAGFAEPASLVPGYEI